MEERRIKQRLEVRGIEEMKKTSQKKHDTGA